MKDYFSTDFKLGVLGGGQLGKMLLTETRKYDIYTCILDPSPEAPSRIGSNEFYTGDLKDYQTVYDFGKKVDLLTIEIEHVNVDALFDLEKEGLEIYPQPSILKIIQDKSVQKEFYTRNNIPTSKFEFFENKSSVVEAISSKRWNLPVVWKATTGGYDGFGVSVIKSESDFESIGDQPGILEEMVNFKKELGVIVARNVDGDIVSYPSVEMEFHPTANQVEFVICPSNISEEEESKAEEIAIEVAKALNITGLLAVEMFVDQDGNILVNEVAPRTHNSGHLTIESNYTSQFEQHLRAILNLPLGSTKLKMPAVMANLVGDSEYSGPVRYAGYQELMALPGVNIHIYGKSHTRPFRKMGHVTVVAENQSLARKLAGEIKEKIKVISK